jgi:hypothetical protein
LVPSNTSRPRSSVWVGQPFTRMPANGVKSCAECRTPGDTTCSRSGSMTTRSASPPMVMAPEVPFLLFLGAARVIAHDRVDPPVEDGAPQRLAIRVGAGHVSSSLGRQETITSLPARG